MKKFQWLLFICVLSIFLVVPSDVFAGDIGCVFDDGTNKASVNIKESDYSTSNKMLSGLGANRLFTFQNWSKITPVLKQKKLKGKNMCPRYMIVIHCSNSSVTGSSDVYEYYAYYKKSTADKQYKNLKRCQQGGFSVKDKTPVIKFSKTAKYETQETTYARADKNKPSAASDDDSNKSMSKAKGIDGSVVGTKKNTKCTDILGEDVVSFLQKLFDYVKVLGPLIVVVLSSIDFTKTVLMGDEDSMKKAQNHLLIRILCAVGIFLLPTLVTVIINLVFGESIANPLCGIK